MSLTAKTHSHAAIIFDHDGTLVDSEGVHCQCWNDVLGSHGASLEYSDYCTDYNGLPTRETAKRIQAKYQLPVAADILYDAKIAALNARLSTNPFPLLPHVVETLDWLQTKGVMMAVASGANRHEVEHSIAAHGLSQYFQNITTKQDVANSKPAPDVYLLAAKRLGAAPEHCLAIEDSDTGEASAAAAGMPCIRLTATAHHEHQAKNMAEVRSLLEKILA